MSIDELREEALKLAPESRAQLARELLASLDALRGDEIERLWVEEAIRRKDQLATGDAVAFPAEGVISRARSRRK